MKNFMKKVLSIAFCTLTICLAFSLGGCKNNGDDDNGPTDLSTLSISCLGDSLTAGEGIDFAYPFILYDTYKMNVRSFGVGWSTCAVVNDCSCHPNKQNAHNAMCLRYSVMPKESDVIAVMCGVNDSGLVPLGTINDTDNTTFYGALNDLCTKLKSEYSKSYVFFMTSFSYDNSTEIRGDGTARKDYYETAVKAICEKYGYDVFDTYNALDFSTDRDTVDNVHPTQEFTSNVWAPAVAEFIKTNYKKP